MNITSKIAKFIRLFQLAMHRASYIRSKSAVWFAMTIFVPGLICMYWIVAIRENPGLERTMSTSFIVSYYLTSVMFASLLISHVKDHVSISDIQQGNLSQYLLRPFSYYFHYMLFEEVPYRILQGSFGLIVIVAIANIFPNILRYESSLIAIMATLVSMALGFLICFTIEMALGLLAFWFYDTRLIFTTYEVMLILLGGINMPISFFPESIKYFAFATPFPSIAYAPTMILIGDIKSWGILVWILYQTLWLMVSVITFKFAWSRGIRKFGASGI